MSAPRSDSTLREIIDLLACYPHSHVRLSRSTSPNIALYIIDRFDEKSSPLTSSDSANICFRQVRPMSHLDPRYTKGNYASTAMLSPTDFVYRVLLPFCQKALSEPTDLAYRIGAIHITLYEGGTDPSFSPSQRRKQPRYDPATSLHDVCAMEAAGYHPIAETVLGGRPQCKYRNVERSNVVYNFNITRRGMTDILEVQILR